MLSICLDAIQIIFNPTLALIGDIKSSPTESPLMEKKELKEAHCPILKQASTTPAASYNSADPLPGPEERRVAFDIGDSDEADSNKEHRVAFDIGDSDDTDYSNSNDGKYAKIQCFKNLCHLKMTVAIDIS